ncbi:MAG: hypothetical protein OSA97_02850 [Nevskia sp.]|nr:hypothetical protein [Nevskia sp.]
MTLRLCDPARGWRSEVSYALGYARAGGHNHVIELLAPLPSPQAMSESEADSVGEAVTESADEQDDLDFVAWEVEDDVVLPEVDAGATDAAAEILGGIAAHEPVDDYADWDDVDVDLPEKLRNTRRRRDDLTGSDLAEVRH